MKASELRIGNWYQNKSDNPKLKFQQITFFEDAHYVSIYCEPIPLTEEWLKKFGFWEKYKSSHNRWYLRASTLNAGCEIIDPEDENTEKLTGNFFYSNSDGAIDVKYVHQLQNLYFALTGEELVINSPD